MDSDTSHQYRTNQYYIAQLNSMEIKICELKAQLQAKDFEIDYLKSCLSNLDSPSALKDLELNLFKVQNENESLRKLIPTYDELIIMKSQLGQALHMKDVFEQKYRELKTQSMLNEKLESIIQEKDAKIKSLSQSLESEKKKRVDLESKLKDFHPDPFTLRENSREKMRAPTEMKGPRMKTNENDKKDVYRNHSLNLSKNVTKEMKLLENNQNIRKNLIFQSTRIGSYL